MAEEKKFVKVLWLKAHWDYAYSAGNTGVVDAERAPALLKGGFIVPVPETVEEVKMPDAIPGDPPIVAPVNTLPEDLPGRDKLFGAGFDSVEKIKEVADGDVLLDAGISVTMLKKIKKYLK